MYSAHVEVSKRKQPNADVVDELMAALEPFHGSVGMSPRGWLSAQISVPAESVTQAAGVACALLLAATGAPAIACEVMTEAEHDAREGLVPVPTLIGATEAAELLGVSRQRVQQMAEAGQLSAQLVGKSLVFARPQVEATAAKKA